MDPLEELDNFQLFDAPEPKRLSIVQYPSPLLSMKSMPVMTSIKEDEGLQHLLNDMAKTVEVHGALGISAIQVGVPLNAMVVRLNANLLLKMVNVTVVPMTTATSYEKEGCLSFPGLLIKMTRHNTIGVSYFDEHGNFHKDVRFDHLAARVIQHELDHCNGVTFMDNVHPLEKESIRNRMKKVKRLLKKA